MPPLPRVKVFSGALHFCKESLKQSSTETSSATYWWKSLFPGSNKEAAKYCKKYVMFYNSWRRQSNSLHQNTHQHTPWSTWVNTVRWDFCLFSGFVLPPSNCINARMFLLPELLSKKLEDKRKEQESWMIKLSLCSPALVFDLLPLSVVNEAQS